MKIIFSRKGFDSQFGGCPSPILPSGRLLSLPIPDQGAFHKISYSDLKLPESEKNFGEIMQELGIKINPSSRCHLDPDIRKGVIPRKPNWRPLFGQVGQSQRHLENCGVQPGDLFLFFGWFKKTECHCGQLRYLKKDWDKHLIFAYFQIGEIIPIHHFTSLPKWMGYHPHADFKRRGMRFNTIYVAKRHLSWDKKLSGAAYFFYSRRLVLTKRGYSRSVWQLPSFFRQLKISYHSEKNWLRNGLFRAASRGQEFVIEENKTAEEWVKKLISTSRLDLSDKTSQLSSK